MVRGNWQRRVEKADAQRQENRARKTRKENREAHRALAAGLLSLLSELGPSSSSALQVWVDSMPGGASKRQFQENHGRGDSSGIGSGDDEEVVRGRGGTGKKKTDRNKPPAATGSPPKKAHPRSHTAHREQGDANGERSTTQNLCSKHFFQGKCAGMRKGKKGKGQPMCRLHHADGPTLAFALKGGNDDSLARAAAAAVPSGADEGAANIVWYLPVDLEPGVEAEKTCADMLQVALSKFKTGVASIVYVVLDKSLIYDRNRDGVMLDYEGRKKGDSLDRARTGSLSSSRDGSLLAKNRDEITEAEVQWADLPASLVELVLTLLPDFAVGILPRVCKRWQKEIGKSSPELWRYLLTRRGFPLPPTTGENDDKSMTRLYHLAFVSNFTAYRDINSVTRTFSMIIQSGRLQTNRPASRFALSDCMALLSDYGRSPLLNKHVGKAKIWGEGSVLLACPDDCSLRLFEAIGERKGAHVSLACRQTLSVLASPEPNAKRGTWYLHGMDLDDEYVCCINARHDHDENFIATRPAIECLCFAKKDDILCASGGVSQNHRPQELEEDVLTTINIQEALIDRFIESSDLKDDPLQLLRALIQNKENLLCIITCKDIVPCGRGHFLFHVDFLTPIEEEIVDHESLDYGIIARRCCLFSCRERKFIWTGNSRTNNENDVIRDGRDVFGRFHQSCLVGSCTSSISGGMPMSSLTSTIHAVLTTAQSNQILIAEVNKRGEVVSKKADGVTAEEINAALGREMSSLQRSNEDAMQPSFYRAIAVSSSHIVVAHNNGMRPPCSILTFSSVSGLVESSMKIPGIQRVLQMQPIRSDHIVLLCTVSSRQEDWDEGQEDITGDWFGLDHGTRDRCRPFSLLLLHVPSRRVIGRFEIPSVNLAEPFMVSLVSAGETVALLHPEGVTMSGGGLRDIRFTEKEKVRNATKAGEGKKIKKKKARLANGAKGRKKDSFARGMSMSG